ncbi:MAG: 16S rRNA (cytosine(1402)-N(4))-methyltransferase RsmH [Oscillospiraceae bacterium]|nr:16S rRNA (cytosine(1402)-N(4))-methyltransferase RsmH [Oscillospiraceae bacterium]
MSFEHIPVLLDKCMNGLDIRPDGIYFDGTCGGGGHSCEIAKRLDPGKGRLIGTDRDPDAVTAASERLRGLPAKVVQANYDEIRSVLADEGIDGVNGVLLDLGVSSHQLDTAERGFSYHLDAPLDMRMSQSGTSARDIVNTFSPEAIKDILYKYGEERFAARIVSAIVSRRQIAPIETTGELAQLVSDAYPAKFRRDKHPARQTFQALRIAVNDEFAHLETALSECFDLLLPGGRLCVITFHSLEDRIVKSFFASLTKGCTCPPDFPVCICGNMPKGKLVTRKPLEADEKELEENPRSRSAKLRIIEKI